MLFLQTDFVLIDVKRFNPQAGEFPELQHWFSEQLLFSVSIQCNGKLRRTWFTADINIQKQSDGGKAQWSWSMVTWEDDTYYDLKDRSQIYEPMRIIRDLWYDVPVEEGLHEPIRVAMKRYYWKQD